MYDVQECPQKFCSTSADLIPATGTTKEGLSGRSSDNHGASMLSPSLLELSPSFAVSSSAQASQGVSLLPFGSPSDLQSQKEEEAFKIKHSWAIHESVVAEKLENEASTLGKEKNLAAENYGESPVSKGICSDVPDLEGSNKELSPAHTSMTKGRNSDPSFICLLVAYAIYLYLLEHACSNVEKCITQTHIIWIGLIWILMYSRQNFPSQTNLLLYCTSIILIIWISQSWINA